VTEIQNLIFYKKRTKRTKRDWIYKIRERRERERERQRERETERREI